MNISLILIARRQVCVQIRGDRSDLKFCGTGAKNLTQQSLQGRKDGYLYLGMVSRTRHSARRPVEHPQRQLKRKTGRFAYQAATRDSSVRFLNKRVYDDRTPGPGMPAVKNLLLSSNVGVRVLSYTTLNALTARSDTDRQRQNPSYRCRKSQP